ncbi:uncharacterized protein LOC131936332 [Physella acuta]|uniref:uncharacterized protein LOC131936332 n=1 Tax=Physella acuta TaxID=109671 RepID=UPI0027DAEF7D|nr:uncharacterized protein LOC131936332 [Physella acuta]
MSLFELWQKESMSKKRKSKAKLVYPDYNGFIQVQRGFVCSRRADDKEVPQDQPAPKWELPGDIDYLKSKLGFTLGTKEETLASARFVLMPRVPLRWGLQKLTLIPKPRKIKHVEQIEFTLQSSKPSTGQLSTSTKVTVDRSWEGRDSIGGAEGRSSTSVPEVMTPRQSRDEHLKMLSSPVDQKGPKRLTLGEITREHMNANMRRVQFLTNKNDFNKSRQQRRLEKVEEDVVKNFDRDGFILDTAKNAVLRDKRIQEKKKQRRLLQAQVTFMSSHASSKHSTQTIPEL